MSKDMTKAYMTILTSEDFLVGVINTYNSLRRFTKVPFVAVLSKKLPEYCDEKLDKYGIITLRVSDPQIVCEYISAKQAADRWNNTLFKLVIFKELGYDKIVYLDSDLLVRGSLDALFDSPHLSAVSDEDFYPGYSRGGLNAGVMVIEPSDAIYDRLIASVVDVASANEVFGDQDIINYCYPKWAEDMECHLDVKYNTCFYDLTTCPEPKAVHFILADKPWMWPVGNIILKLLKWTLTGKWKRVKYYREYLVIERKRKE